MARILNIAIIISMFSVLAIAQGDYKQDRNYSNFKRNYERALTAGAKLDSCSSTSCVRNAQRYAKYARTNFLKKLQAKHSSPDFEKFSNKISTVENKLKNLRKAENADQNAAVIVRLWAYRLDLNAAGVRLPEFVKEYDAATLNTAVNKVLQTNAPGTSDHMQASKLKKILSDYDAHVRESKLFTDDGMVGFALIKSKDAQDPSYYKQILQPSLDVTNAMLKIAPNSSMIKTKRDQLAKMIANADTNAKANKPKEKKVYKDSLPGAVWKNRGLEQQFINAIRAQKFPGITITGAILTSKDWKVTRTRDLTQRYRWMEGVVTAKNAEGECWFQYFNFRQYSSGSGWAKAQRGSSGSRYYYKCQ